MNKLFKNSKKVLASALAFAIVAMSLFTGIVVSAANDATCTTTEGTIDVLEYGQYLIDDLGSNSKYYDSKLADNGETGADWDHAIIIDSAEELVYLCKMAGNETKDKYYKVADGIAGFDLSGGKIDLNDTLEDNLEAIQSSGKDHSGITPGFQGHFDGNGATVYGAWIKDAPTYNYAGLFPCTKGNVEIKNINVTLSSFIGQKAVGGIVGYHESYDSSADDCLIIENCSVTDCYLESKGTEQYDSTGAIIGYDRSYGSGVNRWWQINNCYVNLDAKYFKSAMTAENKATLGGLIGSSNGNGNSDNGNKPNVTNCVVIGIKPYATTDNAKDGSTDGNACHVQHSGLEHHFSNVYTDQPAGSEVKIGCWTRNFTGRVTQLSAEQLKGAAAVENLDLDWSVWMADKNGYPELANAHKKVTLVKGDDGTHAAKCACGFGDITVDCTYKNGTCECGNVLNCSTRKTIYWDGTKATSVATGEGTKDNPYIIKTAAELAFVVGQGADKASVTAGKYYKVDDSIGAIVLQKEDKAADIMALDSAAAVKAYFEAEGSSFLSWYNYGWESSTFCGDIDFNGVTIYGLYMKSTNNAGLISYADAGAALHNVALKNSYMVSTASNYQVGGLIVNSNNYEGKGLETSGIIWLDGCVVANNYMYNSADNVERSGVFAAQLQGEAIYLDNCMAYGNDATYGNGTEMPYLSVAKNNVPVSDSVVAPEALKSTLVAVDNTYYNNMVRNSVFFGTKPYNTGRGTGSRLNDPKCYVNVFTDADVANDKFSNDKVLGATEEQIKTVTIDDLKTADLGDAWYNTNSYPELKSFHDATLTVDKKTADKNGHKLTCSCGFSVTADHTFVLGQVSKCSVCDWECKHEGATTKTDGDCVTGDKHVTNCPICKYTSETDDAPHGHTFTEHAAEPATDCKSCGTIAYKYCSVCEKNYAADASTTEPFANAITDLSDHTYGNHNFGDVNPAVGATDCQSYGTVAYKHCSSCDKNYAADAAANEDVANALESLSDNTHGAHSYDNDCDATCNNCDFVREPADHVYDDENDMYCNVCNAPRTVGWTVKAETSGVYTIAPSTAYTADFSNKDIVVKDNLGIIAYNADKGGYILAAGEYTVKFADNSYLANFTGTLEWTLTSVASTIYADVSANEWYSDAIMFNAAHGIMKGYADGSNNFGVADNIQRQDFVVMLARIAGVDLSAYDDADINFVDVPAGEYYTNAILWAVDAGITTGYAHTNYTVFGVGDAITREQLVTFLYRFATYVSDGVAPEVNEEAYAAAAEYVDYAQVSDFAQAAVAWAIKGNVISGKGGTHIAPASNALRCEVAQIIYNIYDVAQ